MNWGQRGCVGHSQRVGAEKEWRKGRVWAEAMFWKQGSGSHGGGQAS